MTLNWRLRGLAVCTGVLIAPTAYAQSPTALEQAELAGAEPGNARTSSSQSSRRELGHGGPTSDASE